MSGFCGSFKLKILEATDLKPTEYSTRHANVTKTLDPYVSVDVDDAMVYRTQSKTKTFKPQWNESFTHEVEDAHNLTLTIFHDASIPPDDFVANCSVAFDDLLKGSKKDGRYEVWVSPRLAKRTRSARMKKGIPKIDVLLSFLSSSWDRSTWSHAAKFIS